MCFLACHGLSRKDTETRLLHSFMSPSTLFHSVFSINIPSGCSFWFWFALGFGVFVMSFSHSPSLEILLISPYNSSKLCLQHEQHETYTVTVESSQRIRWCKSHSCLSKLVYHLPFKQQHVIDPYHNCDLPYLPSLFPEKHPAETMAFYLT